MMDILTHRVDGEYWPRRIRSIFATWGLSYLMLFPLIETAQAQDCDCSHYSGQCTARMILRGQHLTFSASTTQCAQITYSANGEPSSITISGGAGSTDYLITDHNRRPTLSVDSCSICQMAGAARRGCANPPSEYGPAMQEFFRKFGCP